MHKGYEIEYLYSRFLLSDGVSIDTRSLQPGQLFFALPGTKQDGHTFAQEALKKGASYAVISKKSYAQGDRYLCVKNVQEALQALARFHRSRYKRHLIGITGSNGKTTTKSLLAAALSPKYIVLASEKSYNNYVGVPLTLLRILPQVEVAVLELGTSHPGEIATLAELARPTHGLITHIGKAHLEGLGSEQGVYEEKKALFDFLQATGGCFFRNSRCERLQALAAAPGPQYSFPEAKDDYPITCLATHPRIRFRLPSGLEGEVTLFGEHHFGNLAAAIAVAQHFKVPDAEIIGALSRWKPLSQRFEWKEHRGRSLLLDAYNANPDSMAAAIRAFVTHKAPQKAVILGDMRELGRSSPSEHSAIGKQLALSQDLNFVLLCGKEMKAAAKEVPRAQYFSTKEELQTYLKTHPLPPSCSVLIKGSRGMALESIIHYL